jgi:hypothetical protein
MNEKIDHQGLNHEIDRGDFVRAVMMAEGLDLPKEDIRNLQFKALWQMAAIYRNAHGTRYLARQYGFSREEVKQVLEDIADETTKDGNNKHLEPCYDCSTSKYLSFKEWMDHYLKDWDRL